MQWLAAVDLFFVWIFIIASELYRSGKKTLSLSLIAELAEA